MLLVPAGIYFLDDEIDTISRKSFSSSLDRLSSFGRQLGEPVNHLILVPSLYTVSFLIDNERLRSFSWRLGKAAFIAGGIQQTVSRLVGRGRPRAGFNSRDFNGPTFSSKRISFPSGHTALAFSLATLVADEYEENRWVGYSSYFLASIAAWSRVYNRAHWASDVLFGAIVGHISGRLIILDEKNKVKINPIVGVDTVGFGFSYNF